MPVRAHLKAFIPPIARALPGLGRLAVRMRRHGFSGDYPHFDAALAAAGLGYEDDAIVEDTVRRLNAAHQAS